MKITITLRGTLVKYFNGKRDQQIEVPEGSSAEDALLAAGIDWKAIDGFGFVAINGKRVMITDTLNDGDELKAYSKISGG